MVRKRSPVRFWSWALILIDEVGDQGFSFQMGVSEGVWYLPLCCNDDFKLTILMEEL